MNNSNSQNLEIQQNENSALTNIFQKIEPQESSSEQISQLSQIKQEEFQNSIKQQNQLYAPYIKDQSNSQNYLIKQEESQHLDYFDKPYESIQSFQFPKLTESQIKKQISTFEKQQIYKFVYNLVQNQQKGQKLMYGKILKQLQSNGYQIPPERTLKRIISNTYKQKDNCIFRNSKPSEQLIKEVENYCKINNLLNQQKQDLVKLLNSKFGFHLKNQSTLVTNYFRNCYRQNNDMIKIKTKLEFNEN